MPAAIAHRRALIAAALLSYGGVFAAFLLFEEPGLGIGHFYYVSVALIALATGPAWGSAAGGLAAGAYVAGLYLNHNIPSSDALTAGTGIRVVTYAAIGALIGWFASGYRASDERLRILAERDTLTGLPNTRGFETAITRRLDAGTPFALLLGDMDGLERINAEHGYLEGDETLRRLAELLGNSLAPDDELTRVAGDEFAVLTTYTASEQASRLAARLESVLATEGAQMTFGWAFSPQDGSNALSLYRAANERLYARRLFRGKARAEAELGSATTR